MGRESNLAVLLCNGGFKKGDQMAFVQFMKCVAFLDAVDNAWGCVCVRCTAADGGENESVANRL